MKLKFLIPLILLTLLLRFHLNSPITETETKLPEILTLNLGLSGIRLLTVILGIVTMVIFLRWLPILKLSNLFVILAGLLYATSPTLIRTNIFDLLNTLVLFIITVLLLTLKIKTVKKKFLILGVILIVTLGVFKNYQATLAPANYLYKLDRRLAYDQVEKSPLYNEKFNFNRLIHNKIFYEINTFLRFTVTTLDLDKITSPLQISYSDKDTINNFHLPKIFFVEIPLIIFGVVLLLKQKSPLLFLGILGIPSLIIFSPFGNSLVYLTYFLIICEVTVITALLEMKKRLFKKIILFTITALLFFSTISFQDLLKSHQQLWLSEKDFRFNQIWQEINNLPGYQKIIITDRLGNPEPYFKYYSRGFKNPPNKAKLIFESFKYLESDRRNGELWIGLAGEFVGEYNHFKDVTEIPDGKIVKRINGINKSDIFFGDELWFVETKVK